MYILYVRKCGTAGMGPTAMALMLFVHYLNILFSDDGYKLNLTFTYLFSRLNIQRTLEHLYKNLHVPACQGNPRGSMGTHIDIAQISTM